jgi:predicted small secreted protein
MSYTKYLVIGIIIGMAIGSFVVYSFTQFSQISALQTKVNQLQSENTQLRANQILTTPTPTPSQTPDFTTEKTGNAIQIQSVS